jgi:hypothetical protein
MQQHRKRERLLIDANVQGSLVLRVVIYWIVCIATIELLNLGWLIATGPDQPSFFDCLLDRDWRPSFVRIAASALLLVPIVFDILRMSNRFACPVHRMQRSLRNVVENGTVEAVRLREGDYWHSFAADLNSALSKLAGECQPRPPVAEERPLEQPVAL